MNLKSILLIAVLLAFGALSARAMLDHGYVGIFAFHFTSTAGMQVITDLVIVCILAMLWILADARRSGRMAWPYLLLTLTAGSFGPLLYLLIGELSRRETEQAYA